MSTIERTSAQSPRARCEPRLAYDDGKTALVFLTTAFGLKEQTRMEGPDDNFMAWLEFGHSMLMIGRSGPQNHNLYSPRQTGKPTAEVNVVVDDIDRHFHRAMAAGAIIGTALEDAPWGQRHYEAVDPEGHGWHFMKPLQDLREGKATPEGLELRLVYADERAALKFLTGAFGFREQARMDEPDGSIMAWLGFGEGMVMIGRADSAQRHHSPRETAKPTAMLNLHVDEIDAHYQRAIAQGAQIVTELDDTSWGQRRYEAVDPEGNRWHVMQELRNTVEARLL
jgi:uncharacterized glyoxalase superfamily protein PhnB